MIDKELEKERAHRAIVYDAIAGLRNRDGEEIVKDENDYEVLITQILKMIPEDTVLVDLPYNK